MADPVSLGLLATSAAGSFGSLFGGKKAASGGETITKQDTSVNVVTNVGGAGMGYGTRGFSYDSGDYGYYTASGSLDDLIRAPYVPLSVESPMGSLVGFPVESHELCSWWNPDCGEPPTPRPDPPSHLPDRDRLASWWEQVKAQLGPTGLLVGGLALAGGAAILLLRRG